MSLRVRPTTTTTTPDNNDLPESPKTQQPPPPPLPPSLSQRTLSQTLTSTGQLANLLPTNTLLLLQLLTPIFTNHGSCDSATRPLTAILLTLLSTSCFFASFTDSFKSSDGQIFYGFATFNGMWLFDYDTAVASSSGGLLDLKKYRLRFIDWVHAIVSAFVLITLAVRDKNVINCFYPQPSHEVQEVLDIVIIGLGLICSMVFVLFPTKRHGIGYPVSH